MAGESIQKKLTRFRPPRVQITYDTTEESGKKTKHSLPFVIGALGNYSGHKFKKVKKLKDSKFLSVQKNNFDQVVESIAPELDIKVDNKLNDKTPMLHTKIQFKSMADFNPGNLANNVPALRELMDARAKLSALKDMIDSNEKLESVLLSLSKNKEALEKFLEGAKSEETTPQEKSSEESQSR